MNVALVRHRGSVKPWYWRTLPAVQFHFKSGTAMSGQGHALRISQDSRRFIYPTYLCDPKVDVANEPVTIVSPDIGVFVFKAKSSQLPHMPESAVRLQHMYNNVRSIPLHSECFVCCSSDADSTLSTCSLCLLTSHEDCIELVTGIFPDVVDVGKLPNQFTAINMCKCCRNIKFKK